MHYADFARHGIEVAQLADPTRQQLEEALETGLVLQLQQQADISLDVGLVVVPPRAARADALMVDAGEEALVDPLPFRASVRSCGSSRFA